MFEKLRKWLKGEYVCIHCGKTWYSYCSFGFGTMICPECYRREKNVDKWLFPDMSYWLNRLIFEGKNTEMD